MAEPVLHTLDHIDMLRGLPESLRAEAARLCRWKRYAPGEQIIDRESDSRDVYFVVQGAVRIVIYSASGRELTLDDLLTGAFFGELAAIDGLPRSASAMAVQDSTVASLPADQFLRLLHDYPEMTMRVMKRLAAVIRAATERIIDLSTLGANNRVHAELLRLARGAEADADGNPVIKPIPVHGDIASRVSTTRETVARVMNDLARAGIVRRDRDALLVLDLEKLDDMVEAVRGE